MKIISRVALSVIPFTLVAILAAVFTSQTVAQAAQFFCSSGNVTYLIAAINNANRLPGEHAIILEPGFSIGTDRTAWS